MSKLTRRMLGLPDPEPGAAVSGQADRLKPLPAGMKPGTLTPNPRHVGLQDAAMAGLYNKAKGEVFDGVRITPEDVVVDVGCGEGAALGFCADQGAAIVAVDIHQGTLDTARQFLDGKPARSQEFHVGTAEELPLDSGIATRVLCMEVLEHVADPRTVLREMHRIGRAGALYLITVPDAKGEELTRLLGPDDYFQPPNHIRIIGRDELEGWVRQAGLEILAHRYYGFFWVLWFNLFWNRGVDIEAPEDPVLKHWTLAWKALLDSENGLEVKRKFDEFMPKSQVIVARKPEA